MSLFSCPREQEIQAAAAGRRWTAELRNHAATCRHCGDVALVTATLDARPGPKADMSAVRPPLAGDPVMIWTRARFSRRLRAQAQVSRLMTIAQMTVGLIVAAALVFVAASLDLVPQVPEGGIGRGIIAALATLLLSGVALLTLLTRQTTRRS